MRNERGLLCVVQLAKSTAVYLCQWVGFLLGCCEFRCKKMMSVLLGHRIMCFCCDQREPRHKSGGKVFLFFSRKVLPGRGFDAVRR